MNAWGITLLWTAVQVSVLCAAGAGLYLLMRRRSSAAAAWTLCAVLLVVVGVSALGISPWPRWTSIDEVWQQIGHHEAAGREGAEGSVTLPEPNGQEQARAGGAAESTEDNDAALAAAWREFAAGFQDSIDRDEQSWAWRWPAWLALVTLLGIGLGVARLAVAIVSARRFGGRASVVERPDAIAIVAEIQHALSSTRRIELRQSNCLGSPCTLGWLRPIVVLPNDWSSWTEDELRSVLAHEVAHIARGDFAAGMLAQLGVALHFYNPLVWWLAARLRLEQELAADECGVRLAGGRQTYLTTLARMALRQSDLPLAARAFLPARGTLLRRVEMLHKEANGSERAMSLSARMAVMALLLVASGVLAGVRGPGQSIVIAAPPDSPAAQSGATEDDVRSIIAESDPKVHIQNLRDHLKKVEAFMNAHPERVTAEMRQARDYLQQQLRDTVNFVTRHPETWGIKVVPVEEMRADNQVGLRQQSMNKLRRIGIALHLYHDTHKRFPSAVVMGPDGKTPHSWRVELLPFIEGDGQSLYDRYRLNEPWDSENNLQVMKDGAELFSVPSEEPSANCGYFALVGPGSIFFPANVPTTIRDIRDGTSKTIALIEAKRDIPWTKPEDIEFEADKPLPKLGGYFRGGYNTLFCDGHMVFMPADVKDDLLRKLITKAGREPWNHADIVRESNNVDPAPTPHEESRQVNTNPPNAFGKSPSLRQQSMDKLKTIGLALHGYYDANKRFPLPVEMGPDGKTQHSWRVAVLPYFGDEEAKLFGRYQLNEPWDSEGNQKIVAEGAHLYSVPSEQPSEDCGYFVFSGPGTVFDPQAVPSTLQSITDGTSLTMGVVEAKRSVPWTKPEDIPYSPDQPLPKLGGFFEGGFNSAFMDGAAHFLPSNTPEDVLRALVSKNGGELIRVTPEGTLSLGP